MWRAIVAENSIRQSLRRKTIIFSTEKNLLFELEIQKQLVVLLIWVYCLRMAEFSLDRVIDPLFAINETNIKFHRFDCNRSMFSELIHTGTRKSFRSKHVFHTKWCFWHQWKIFFLITQLKIPPRVVSLIFFEQM